MRRGLVVRGTADSPENKSHELNTPMQVENALDMTTTYRSQALPTGICCADMHMIVARRMMLSVLHHD